jgi:hypothetical protein
MVRLRRRNLLARTLTILANGCAAGAGGLLAFVTIGAIKFTPIVLAVLVAAAILLSLSAEIVESPKKGPKHAAR